MLYIAVIDNVKRKMVKVVKAKSVNCRVRARTRARELLIHSFLLIVFSPLQFNQICFAMLYKKAGIHR